MSAPPRSEIPTLSTLPLVIDTPRLRLRPPQESDAEGLFPHVSDPQVAQYVTWAAHTSIEQTRQWLRDIKGFITDGSSMVWLIEHAGIPIGCIGVHGITWALRAVRYDRAELGYWLGRSMWGQGLMSEAAAAVVRWAFDTLGLHKLNVMCFEENTGSRRVIDRCGFRFVGRLEEDIWRDGRWHAHLRYELTAGSARSPLS